MPVRQVNYLLGKGEKLTEPVEITHGGGTKQHAYTFKQAKARLTPKARAVAKDMESLPKLACPKDEAVAVLTLHPAYLAKSFYPETFLGSLGLRAVGSRPVIRTPERSQKDERPKPSATADLFIAGPRATFKNLADSLPIWSEADGAANDLIKIEDLRPFGVTERMKPIRPEIETPLLEVVLHTGAGETADEIRAAFVVYLRSLGIAVDLSRRIDSGYLSFIPVRAPADRVTDVAKFSFLRVIREMPALRPLQPVASAKPVASKWFTCSLPQRGPFDK